MGTFYKNIYNLDKKEFEDQLDANEVDDQTQYEIAEEDEELTSEDDSVLGGDLEMDEEEQRMLEMADEVGDIEDLAEQSKIVGKKRKQKPKVEFETEIEDLGTVPKHKIKATLKRTRE